MKYIYNVVSFTFMCLYVYGHERFILCDSTRIWM